jgi:hypothetical protein
MILRNLPGEDDVRPPIVRRAIGPAEWIAIKGCGRDAIVTTVLANV